MPVVEIVRDTCEHEELRMKRLLYASLISAMFFNMPASAIEEAIELQLEEEQESTMTLFGNVKEKEVFSFSNYAESIESTGASVDVITRKDIEKQHVPSVSELLNQVGSLQIQNSKGSAGSVSSIYMRGTDRVRLTIDGVRADRPSLTSPTAESQFILADDLERIEVIKGPQGNLAGTNASGGLIAMQTRRGRGPLSIEMGSDFGNLGTFKERFAIMNGNDSWDQYTGITWFKTDGGMRSSDLGRIHNDDYNNLSIVNNIGKRLLDEKAEVRNIFRFSRARKDVGIGYADAYPYGTYQDPNNYGLNYDIMNTTSFRHAPTEKYNYDAKFSIYHNESDNFTLVDDWSAYENISKLRSTRLNAQTQHNYKLFDWNTLSVGYNLESEFINSLSDSISYGFHSSDKFSGNTLQNDVYINDVINIKDMLFIRGGARLIHHSDFGTYVTPNASASLILPTFKLKGAKTKLRGSWGQSVNNPTLYQRFAAIPYMMVSNPNLEAEKMNSWDVGIAQSFFDEKLTFDFGYFKSHYKDYIGYAYIDPIFYVGQYQNIDEARIQGYEGKITWAPKSWFKTVLSYTYTDSEDKATGHELVGTPKNSFKGNLYWTPHEAFSSFLGVVANTGRFSSMTSTQKTNSYVDVNLGTKVRLWKGKDTEVYLNAVLYNLFDQDISMYNSGSVKYYAPGIHFRAGLSMKYTLPERKKKEVL